MWGGGTVGLPPMTMNVAGFYLLLLAPFTFAKNETRNRDFFLNENCVTNML